MTTSAVALRSLYGITEGGGTKGVCRSITDSQSERVSYTHTYLECPVQADLLLLNGNFHTMERQCPRASAVAIAGERFVAAGSDAQMRALLARGGREVDLRGATVVPGFIDAHIHFLSYGLSLQEIDLSGVDTLASALERVRQRAAQTPAGQWLTGRGWDQSVWEGGAFPTASQLDAVAPQHPVFLARKCGHAAWVNSRALELMGIYGRNDGSRTAARSCATERAGRAESCLERAMGPAYCLLTEPSPQAAVAAVREAQKVANRMGVVGVHTKEAAASLRAFPAAARRGGAHSAHGRPNSGGRTRQRHPPGAAYRSRPTVYCASAA